MVQLNTHENKAFSKEIPALQVAWDSTSLGLLKTCPRKYFYQIIQGWRPKGQSIHLTFGIAYHSALEAYDKARCKDMDHEEAVIVAVRSALAFTDPPDPDKNKNKFTLVRSVVWYLDKFGKDDPAKTIVLENGKPAVELSFRMGIGVEAADGSEYLLCGHLDRVVEFGNDVFVMDRKTTKSTMSDYYFNQFSPNNQMTLYTLASQIISKRAAKGVIIDAVQLAVGFSRFARAFAYRTKAQLDEWFGDTVRYLRMAERMANEQSWPMNDTACDKFGGCPFREICAADPGVRELYLKSNFEQRIWDPLEARD